LAHYLGLKYLFLFVLRFGSVRDPDKHWGRPGRWWRHSVKWRHTLLL